MDLIKRKLIKWFGSIWLFGISPIFILIWLLWRLISLPVPAKIYQLGDDLIYSLYQIFVIFVYEHVAQIEIIFTGDYDAILEKKENVILFSNHQSTFDWMIADILAIRQGSGLNTSIGRIRYLLKDELKWAPLYGFYFRQHNCIYVKRNAKLKLNTIEDQLKDLITREVPYWMVVFPEGTRYDPDNLKSIGKSQEFAKKNDITPFEHVLTPRTKGLQVMINELRSNLDAVYDLTIGFSEVGDDSRRTKAPALLEFLTRQCSVHINISRIDLKDIPKGDLTDWIIKRYRRKDSLLSRLYGKEKNFSDVSIKKETTDCPTYKTIPIFIFWALISIPIIFTSCGQLFYLYSLGFTLLVCYVWVAFKQSTCNYY